VHRSELPQRERDAKTTDAALSIQGRPSAVDNDKNRQQQQQRSEDEKCAARQHQVDDFYNFVGSTDLVLDISGWFA
jgi:hypothetical protein